MSLCKTAAWTHCLATLGVIALSAALALPAAARTSGPKRTVVSEIIVHATGGPSCQRGRVVFSPPGDLDRMQRFFARNRVVSIHYIVGRDGRIAASVPEDEVARHTRDNNDHSIGIELINAGDGHEPFPQAQVDALIRLVGEVRRRWRVPIAQVKGHDDVDNSTFRCGGREVRRKQDPGPRFPWALVRARLKAADMGHPAAVGAGATAAPLARGPHR
ncbi:MAG: peptidoglycan recognition family protein [Hyphomicrobiaceae bacterium]